MMREVIAVSRGRGSAFEGLCRVLDAVANVSPHNLRQPDRNGVSDLSRCLRAWTLEVPRVREGLDTRALTDREIAMRAIVKQDDVLTAGYPMDSCLDGLSRMVKPVARVPFIESSSRNADVEIEVLMLLPVHWLGKGRKVAVVELSRQSVA